MSYLEALFSLQGKGAVVTGAARGNGRAMAEALLRAGAATLLVDRLEDELHETVATLRAQGLAAFPLVADITPGEFPDRLVAEAVACQGGIDILVNNAGVTFSHGVLEYPEAAWETTYQVNLKAPFRIARAVARHMVERGGGSIINITSLNAELAFPDNPAYVACKGGLKQLSKSMAMDLGHLGIRVNNVGPGYFHTDMTKKSYADPERNRQRRERTVLGRWGEPEDLAGGTAGFGPVMADAGGFFGMTGCLLGSV
ncbi:MAG: SDR family NAD(P)-dependent oxidoreductase, partial [Magnetococcales bacterium]|nr:SDR family NAD(P)-dependent oxidoreductase [Magnetococcales bacterium]